MSTTLTVGKAVVNSYNPYVTLTVTESSTSATANTSTLSYSLVLYRPSSVTSSASKSYTITINGTAHSGTTTIGGSGTKTITSGTQTVSHSSDGTKTITIKLSFTFGLTWSGTSMGTYSGSTTMTLTSLDRTAPTITISSTSVTNSTIYFAATSNVSCNTWQYSTNGGSSYTTFNSGSATSVTKTISGLSANTTYSLRVRAYKVANNISSYASKSVTTLGASSITSASSVTMSDDGTACAVKFTPYSTAYYFTVGFSLGDMSWTSDRFCPASTSAYTYTDYSFITSEWAPYITSAASGTCTATLTTYASSSTTTVMGTSTKTFTLTVPSSCTPTVDTFTVSEAASSFPSAFSGAYVLGLSELEFSATASGIYDSSISAITYTLGSDTYEGEADDDGVYTASTDALTISGDYTVTATVTDSRGYTTTATEDITIYEYSSPTVSSLTFDISGTSCKVTATGACSSVNSLNTAYITFTAVCVSDVSNTQTASYTKTVDEDAWTSAGAYSFSHTFTLDTVQTETYKITFEIEDETGTSATLSKQTGVICFSRLAGGKGAAFFKEAENEGLEVAGAATFESTLEVIDSDENIRLGVYDDEIYIGGSPRFTGTTYIRTAGYITSSGKSVSFTIPYVAYGATPTLEVNSVQLRQAGNYLGGGSSDSNEVTESYSAAATYVSAGYFIIILTFDSAPTNYINNDVVGVYCNYTVS